MCGILYKSRLYEETNENLFISALRTIKHRGPDEEGILFTNKHMLGHERLSIVDLNGGHQPMSIINKHLIYNGELYNIDELKQMLDNNDLKGDTNILIELLNKYGINILNKLNGIFGFVFVDDDIVYAGRDPYGVKPLFYSLINNDIIISSEIKAILKLRGEAIVNSEGLRELIGMGPSHSVGKTIYKDIYELPPGCYLKYNNSKLEIIKYYTLPTYKTNMSYNECKDKVKELVTNAIKRQMISDLDIATFLSGGLDSSIISTIVSKNKKNLDCYTIDYEDNEKDFKPNEFERSRDYDYALLVSNDIKANLHKALIDNDTLINNLKKAVICKDGPGMTDIDSSMIFIAEEISKKYKVALSGECADELFGGYSWFYTKAKEKNTFPWIRNLADRENLLNEKWKKKLNIKEYVQNEYLMALNEAPISNLDNQLEINERRMTYLNIRYFMTNLLDRKDRMTMGANPPLEARVPFCDKELVEFLYNLPFKYKYRFKTEKKILRDAFSDELNEKVINRRKSPYPKSNSKEYERRVNNLLKEVLKDKNSILYELFDIEKINSLLDSDKELNTPWYGQLMRKTAFFAYLYQIDFWYKEYNIRIED